MRTFEYVDDKSAKFWSIDLAGKSFTVRYGKIGTIGQTQTKEFADEAKAKKEYDKLIAEKVGKGYVEVGTEQAATAPAPEPRTKAAPKRAKHQSPSEQAPGEQMKPAGSPTESAAVVPPLWPPVAGMTLRRDRRRFFRYPPDKPNQCWSIELHGNRLDITVTRMRGTPKKDVKRAKTDEAALALYERLIAEKVADGYIEDLPTRRKGYQIPPPAYGPESVELAAEIDRRGGRAIFAGGAVWVQIPLSDNLQRAYRMCDEIHAPGVLRFYDLMLFRVTPTEPLRQEILPAGAFDQLDGLIVTAGRAGGAWGQWTNDSASPGHHDYEMDWDDYCFTERRTGDPLPRVFEFAQETREAVQRDSEAEPGLLQRFEAGLAELDAALTPALAEFQSAGYFARNEPLFVHWVDDSGHPHGCISVPWRVSVGLRYALVEVWRGGWY